jgi:hypothetical protein
MEGKENVVRGIDFNEFWKKPVHFAAYIRLAKPGLHFLEQRFERKNRGYPKFFYLCRPQERWVSGLNQ